MIRRMIGKELRENWVGAAVMFCMLAGGTFVGTYSRYLAGPSIFTPRALPDLSPLLFVGLFIGLRSYSSELAHDRTSFLMSRPISWKTVLALKFITTMASIAVVTVVIGLLYWLWLPSDYWTVPMFRHVWGGTALFTLCIAIGYIAGLSCSVVLPGLVGSATMLALVYLCGLLTVTAFDVYEVNSLMWPIVAWIVAAPIAMVVVARFGITLEPLERLRRYAVVCLAIVALMSPAGFIVPVSQHTRTSGFGNDWPYGLVRWDRIGRRLATRLDGHDQLSQNATNAGCWVSPDGSLALVRYKYRDGWRKLLDLRTGKVYRLQEQENRALWLEGTSENVVLINNKKLLRTLSIDQRDMTRRDYPIALRPRELFTGRWHSPDSKAVLLHTLTEDPPAKLTAGPQPPVIPGRPGASGPMYMPAPYRPPQVPTKYHASDYILVMLDTGQYQRMAYDLIDHGLPTFSPLPKDNPMPGKYVKWARWLISYQLERWNEER